MTLSYKRRCYFGANYYIIFKSWSYIGIRSNFFLTTRPFCLARYDLNFNSMVTLGPDLALRFKGSCDFAIKLVVTFQLGAMLF